MTFIALPIVPDEPVGPFGGVNPREIWLIAIVLAGVSFVGYVAVKVLGARHGILLAAAAGGLVSSTAVTASNARRAAAGEGAPRLLAAGVALATAVSFARVLAIVGVLKPELLTLVAPPLAAAILVARGLRRRSLPIWRGGDEHRATGASSSAIRSASGRWSASRILLGSDRAGRPRSRRNSRCRRRDRRRARARPCRCRCGHGVDGAADAGSRLSLQSAALAILAAVVSNNVSKIAIGAVVGRGGFALETRGDGGPVSGCRGGGATGPPR